jgi:HAD superfamily hydrolase (TIGR01509 family)
METPAAVLFDMDGLLLDSERVYRAVLTELLLPFGHTASAIETLFLSLVGVSGTPSRALLRPYVPHDLEAFDAAWHGGVRARLSTGVLLRPTVRESVTALKQAGVSMAVVTSTHGAAARRHLEHAGLLKHFEFVVAGDEVTATKPDPAPYLQAAATLGIDAARCAAFEDSDAGTTSAARAGCITTQIPDLRPTDRALPDLGQHVAPNVWAGLQQLGLLNETVNSNTVG